MTKRPVKFRRGPALTARPIQLPCDPAAGDGIHVVEPKGDPPTSGRIVARYYLAPDGTPVEEQFDANGDPAGCIIDPPTMLPPGGPPEAATGETADKSECAPKKGRATVNARMLDMIQNNPDCRGWTARNWARCLKCSPSSVAGTPTWGALKMIREQLKAERAKDRRRRPRGSQTRRD